MTILRSGILTISVIILSLIIIMTIPTISIEKNRTAIQNHYAYSSSFSYPAVEASNALADFNFAAAGDWGCTSDTINTVKNIIDQNPEFVLALGELSYDDNAKCWIEIITPIANKTMI